MHLSRCTVVMGCHAMEYMILVSYHLVRSTPYCIYSAELAVIGYLEASLNYACGEIPLSCRDRQSWVNATATKHMLIIYPITGIHYVLVLTLQIKWSLDIIILPCQTVMAYYLRMALRTD